MREIRQSGSEGGAVQANAPSLPLSIGPKTSADPGWIFIDSVHKPAQARARYAVPLQRKRMPRWYRRALF